MILINKEEKDLVLKNFPSTKFYRTCKQKSSRHRYYMAEEKDQLRFLCGMDKTRKNYKTGEVEILIKGNKSANNQAIKAFEQHLLFNIQYYNGDLGGGDDGSLLDEEQISKSVGLKKFCEFELSQLRKRYKEILRR